jgi:enoyl-CoA hydratase
VTANSQSTVDVSRSGRVLVVTIDRPQVRNAVDRPTADALVAAFEEFEGDPELDVAVLTGADGTFCSGADLGAIAEGNGNRIVADQDVAGPMGPTRMSLSKPVIAAVEGFAVAGGLELALWCDLRVASRSASFGVFCRRWGVPLVDGGTVRLPRLVGHGRAMDMILTGREVSASEAKDIGLVDRLVEPGTAREAAIGLGHELSDLPQICMRSDRRSAIGQWSLDERSALRAETELGIAVISSGETIEGAQRFRAGAGRHGESGRTARGPAAD